MDNLIDAIDKNLKVLNKAITDGRLKVEIHNPFTGKYGIKISSTKDIEKMWCSAYFYNFDSFSILEHFKEEL